MPKKCFTVGYFSSRSETTGDNVTVPYIRMMGKWLKEYGINVGDKLELVKGDNMITLIKIPSEAVKQQKTQYEISKLEKQIRVLKEEL